MKIYLASSFRHVNEVRVLADKIRFYNHDVYCFCDEKETAFRLSTKIRENDRYQQFTPKSALKNGDVFLLGLENWNKLVDADIVIVALPCGRSAHLEAGWAKGREKKVYVYGPMVVGEFDAMYVMVDGVFGDDEFNTMMDVIDTH